MNKTARNECIKLMAAWLNGGAIAALAIGCFAPVTGYATGAASISLTTLGILIVTQVSISVGLHLISRRMLQSLE